MALAFLEHPEQKPDAGCIDGIADPKFVLPVTDQNLVPFQSETFCEARKTIDQFFQKI
jgi:hypothetical protein